MYNSLPEPSQQRTSSLTDIQYLNNELNYWNTLSDESDQFDINNLFKDES